MSQEFISLSRDVTAIQIPYGNTLTARAGTEVAVVHALGDTFTLRTRQGYLIRVDAQDADALGMEVPAAGEAKPKAQVPDTPVTEPQLWDVLRTCYDPEIPANIVDIGLIYSCRILPPERGVAKDAGVNVDVEMTLTAPGCGMGQVLHDDVERKILDVPGVAKVDVRLVFEPPWDISMMSEAARLDLGMF